MEIPDFNSIPEAQMADRDDALPVSTALMERVLNWSTETTPTGANWIPPVDAVVLGLLKMAGVSQDSLLAQLEAEETILSVDDSVNIPGARRAVAVRRILEARQGFYFDPVTQAPREHCATIMGYTLIIGLALESAALKGKLMKTHSELPHWPDSPVFPGLVEAYARLQTEVHAQIPEALFAIGRKLGLGSSSAIENLFQGALTGLQALEQDFETQDLERQFKQ